MRPTLRRTLALALLGGLPFTTSAHADAFPTGCVFLKASPNGDHGEEVQFLPGMAFSVAVIHDGYGRKPTYCFYSIQTTPYQLACHGQSPETFSFVGPTRDLHTHDILIFRNAAWYKVCYKPL